MYSTKTAITTESNGNYMPVGINDNITLTSVEVKKSPTGLDFLEIVFSNEDGQTASFTEWKNTKGQFITTDEDLQRRDNLQFGKMMQLINCFYQNVEDVELSNFAEMINWVKSKLDPMIPTKKKLRVKVIYDNKGYTRVSGNGIYVEPMDVEKSRITLWKRDLMERPIVADKEDSLISKSTTDTPKSATDDLPF